MPTHPGQMACFGGYRKEGESHPFQVVVRELEEESGVSAEAVEPLGMLRPIATSRGVHIVPVVGRLRLPLDEFFRRAVSNGEWTDLLAVPWADLADRDRWEWGWHRGAVERKILAFPILPGRHLHQTGSADQAFFLWGATARMAWDSLALYDAGFRVPE